MTLEEKIKALMEAKAEQSEELLSEESIEELEEAKVKVEKDGTIEADSDDKGESEKDDDHEEPDGDEDGEDTDNDGDGDTEMSQDPGPSTKKNKVEVKEGSDPFGGLDSNGGDSAGDAGKTAKLKAGLSRKEGSAGKLATPPSSGATDDNGDNARLKSGLGKKESSGKLTGPSAGGSENPEQSKNNAGTEIQKGADKNPVGVKEHMSALFQGEELSEEFQTKAATIFEAAVESVAAARIEALQEEYAQEILKLQEEQEQELIEAVDQVKDELVESIDGYLNLVVEQWISENQVALESGIKVDVVNNFIDGLKTLFKENYVDIPEDKLDVIEEQAAEIQSMAETVNALAEENAAIQQELVELKTQLIFEGIIDDLTVQQAEKFAELVENVEFTNEEEFADKLKTLKESYFPKSASAKTLAESVATEQPVVSNEVMSAYVNAIGQKLKF